MMRAKKSLGQNFLRSGKALNTIIEAGKVLKEDTVLEIGPGKGALTERLLQSGASVVAVEKDNSLIPLLEEKFAKEINEKRFKIINGDILEMDAKSLKLKSYKLIANIPYYITGAIIRKFLEESNQPSQMVLLVQKEVGERIVSRDKKESLLSIAVKAYSDPRYIAKVGRESFSPAPNVDSAVVSFENISKDNFKKNKIKEERFFEILHKGFAHKRKRLGGNLKSEEKNLNPNKFEEIKEKRAEDLALCDWIELLR